MIRKGAQLNNTSYNNNSNTISKRYQQQQQMMMFGGSNYRKLNKSVEMLQDYNDFLRKNVPISIASAAQVAASNRRTRKMHHRHISELEWLSSGTNGTVEFEHQMTLGENGHGGGGGQHDIRMLEQHQQQQQYFIERSRKSRSRAILQQSIE